MSLGILSAYQREGYFPPGKVSCVREQRVQGLGRWPCIPCLCPYVCKKHTHGLGCVPMLFRSAFRKVDVFDASLNLPVVSYVFVLRTGEKVHVYTLIIETLHMW